MKKLFVLFTLFLFLLPIVFSQSNIGSSDLIFEKLVVKEHFVTKKEVKDHIDKKVLEYQKTTENILINSFAEVENILNSKINKLVFKMAFSILALMFFSNSLWYFIKKKLDRRYENIIGLLMSEKKASKGLEKLRKTKEFQRLEKEKEDILKELKSLKDGS